MKKFRKVDLKTVLAKTLIYRIFIILVQVVFTYRFILNWKEAFNISILWNFTNIILYFIYEYLFSKKYDTTIQTKGFVLWFTGLPCSGKSTLADKVADILKSKGLNVERLDGDIVRKQGLSDDLGFSKEDRDKNINRVIFVSKVLSRNKTAVIASFVSPYRKTRTQIKESVTNFVEIYAKASAKECEKRDVKGMWAKAKKGEIKGFTGYDDPYEIPITPQVILNTEKYSIKKCVAIMLDYLRHQKLI